MNEKYSLKDKTDGKWHTFGNINPGEKGPRCGLRVTPELRALVNGKSDGEWLNFLAFLDDGQRSCGGSGGGGYGQAAAPARQPNYSTAGTIDDINEVPF